MIIKCVNCNKIFDVNSSLIPDKGRNIQCGSCNHIWFYKHIHLEPSLQKHNNKEFYVENEAKINDNKIVLNQDTEEYNNKDIDKQDLSKKNEPINIDKQINFSLGKVFSYIIVSIISFIAIVVFLDTFKSPLSNIFPDLELLLYNLFESILDMFLFIKNLLV